MSGQVSLLRDREKMDVVRVHSLIAQSYWARGIGIETFRRAMENSDCFALVLDEKQIAFCRVISDRCTFAYLCDVIVEPDKRGQGYGSAMLRAVTSAQEFANVRRWLLATMDAHGVYRKLGFRALHEPASFMEILVPDAYAPAA